MNEEMFYMNIHRSLSFVYRWGGQILKHYHSEVVLKEKTVCGELQGLQRNLISEQDCI